MTTYTFDDFGVVSTKLTNSQVEKVLDHAMNVSKKLNMYGDETRDEIAREILIGRTDRLDGLVQPECRHRRGTDCGHAFPSWFIRDAKVGRDVAALRRYARSAGCAAHLLVPLSETEGKIDVRIP